MRIIRVLTLMLMLAGFGTSVGAESAWTGMRPNSFPDTPASAKEQCIRAAKSGIVPQLNYTKCDQLESLLTNGQCPIVMVPDGTRYYPMNFNHDGVVGVSPVRKQHGHDTPARRCNLGDGVTADFYIEGSGACHNLGIVQPPKSNCRWVPIQPQQSPPQVYSAPSFGFADDCGDYFQFGGTQTVLPPTTITGSKLVCD